MSWEQLLAIQQTAQQVAATDAALPPVACPNDGEPLLTDPNTGELRCKFDGWIWDGMPVTY